MMVFGMARPWRNLQPITRGGHVFHYAIPTDDKELFVWLLFTHIIEGKSHIVLMYPKPCVGWRRCFSATNTCQLKGRSLEIICQQRQLAKRVPMRITGRCINLVYYFKFIVYVVYLSASTNPGQFKWTTL